MEDGRNRTAQYPRFGMATKTARQSMTPPAVSPIDVIPRLGKGERGLVMSRPMELDLARNKVTVTRALDQVELRFDLLFWDKLARPVSVMGYQPSNEMEYLEGAGVLFVPKYGGPFNGALADILYQTHMQAYFDLDQRDPGGWALSEGNNSLMLSSGVLVDQRGVLVTLQRAVPVPDLSVSLDEVLEFKTRRRDEMLALRGEVEGFYESVLMAQDRDLALRRYAEKIDAACADILRVAKERRFPIKMGDWSASIDVNEVGSQAVKAWASAQTVGLDNLTALLAGGVRGAVEVASSVLKVGLGLGLAKSKVGTSPYRYVVRIHDELT